LGLDQCLPAGRSRPRSRRLCSRGPSSFRRLRPCTSFLYPPKRTRHAGHDVVTLAEDDSTAGGKPFAKHVDRLSGPTARWGGGDGRGRKRRCRNGRRNGLHRRNVSKARADRGADKGALFETVVNGSIDAPGPYSWCGAVVEGEEVRDLVVVREGA